MAAYKRIAIIGTGIFGLCIMERLQKLQFKIDVYEKKKSILSGASSNNLNRLHQGFHYPRSKITIEQSYKNYKIFIKKYKDLVKKKLNSYYLISKKNSKVNLKNYLKISKTIPFFSKEISGKQIPIKVKNISGGILTNEKIYDWNIMKNFFKKKKFNNVKFFFNTHVYSINKNKTLIIKKKENYIKTIKYDYIIDCSYIYQNNFKKSLGIKIKKKIYQKTLVLELKFQNCPNIGIAVMDGNFISFLPKGNSKKIFLLYDVKNSILKKKICLEYPKSLEKKITNKKIFLHTKRIIKKLSFFFPNLYVKKILKYRISDRVLELNKSDRRITKIKLINKSIFFVDQGKVDHCIEAANNIYNKIKELDAR